MEHFIRLYFKQNSLLSRHLERIFVHPEVFFCHLVDVLVCPSARLLYNFTSNCHHFVRVGIIHCRDCNRGSRDTFFCLTLPSAVLTRMTFPSTSTQIGVTCGDP